jgi:hypothetical protein
MMSTRLGILDNHPTLKKGILKQLQSTWHTGTAVTATTIHAFVTAYLLYSTMLPTFWPISNAVILGVNGLCSRNWDG